MTQNWKETAIAARIGLGITWIYQGLVPKLLFPEMGEMLLLNKSALFTGYEQDVLTFFAYGQIAFGLIFFLSAARIMYYLNIGIITLLTVGAFYSEPELFAQPFNPISVSVPMIFLSLIAIWSLHRSDKRKKGHKKHHSLAGKDATASKPA